MSIGRRSRAARPRRSAQYRQHARHIDEHVIGNVKLAVLTTPRINLFRDDLLATMSRVMSPRKVMSSLKSLLRDAQHRGNVAPARTSPWACERPSTPTSAPRAD